MNDELDKLERDVEQGMRLLRDLPAIPPGPACVARVKAAVSAEARRVMRRRRLLRWTGSGAAAAVLLVVVGITFWHGRQARGPGSDAALTEWATALDESNAR